jgi:hypothetical protein
MLENGVRNAVVVAEDRRQVLCDSIQTTPLMTAAQAVEALRKTGTCGYKSITAGASAAAAGS